MICSWCGADSEANRLRHEGPHSTWCVHYRRDEEFQRAMDLAHRPLGVSLADMAEIGRVKRDPA